MNIKQAVFHRISRRKYENIPIRRSQLETFDSAVKEVNKVGNINIKMILNDPTPFSVTKSFAMISGAMNYFVLIGRTDSRLDEEKLGYYGESIVLLATTMGLGTCWVAGTYDKNAVNVDLKEDEEIKGIIVFGNVKPAETFKERTISKVVKRNYKDVKDLLSSNNSIVPNWVVEGVKYASKAPSAQNRQPVRFFCSDDFVIAKVSGEHRCDYLDLGIAKLHFEIGAGYGKWEFGNGGIFKK